MTPQKCDIPPPFDCAAHFRQLGESLAEIQVGIAEIKAMFSDHERRLERAERTLFGNGGTGICTKVSAILWIVSGLAAFSGLVLARAIANIFRI